MWEKRPSTPWDHRHGPQGDGKHSPAKAAAAPAGQRRRVRGRAGGPTAVSGHAVRTCVVTRCGQHGAPSGLVVRPRWEKRPASPCAHPDSTGSRWRDAEERAQAEAAAAPAVQRRRVRGRAGGPTAARPPRSDRSRYTRNQARVAVDIGRSSTLRDTTDLARGPSKLPSQRPAVLQKTRLGQGGPNYTPSPCGGAEGRGARRASLLGCCGGGGSRSCLQWVHRGLPERGRRAGTSRPARRPCGRLRGRRGRRRRRRQRRQQRQQRQQRRGWHTPGTGPPQSGRGPRNRWTCTH